MSTHGKESDEGKHSSLESIITNLEYILKEHCHKIKLIESHLLFMKEKLDEGTPSTVGKVEIVQEETKKEFQQLD